jgi:hypothetical protein
MADSHEEKKALKVERTLVRLKYSLLGDDELYDRTEARKRALRRGDPYIIDVPDLLGSADE